MPIFEATEKAEQQEMTTCIRCPKMIPARSPSIQHMPGWACSQRCSNEADEAELLFHAQSQTAVAALFIEPIGQGPLQK